MKVKNHKNFAFTDYNQYPTNEHKFGLGDIIIGVDSNEIGVIIQLHSDGDYRNDMFGNCSNTEIRLAKKEEIEKFRPNLLIDETKEYIRKKK